MNNANLFLERTCVMETDDFGEILENVSLSDALTACKIQELETLKASIEHSGSSWVEVRIQQLTKELKNIKFK